MRVFRIGLEVVIILFVVIFVNVRTICIAVRITIDVVVILHLAVPVTVCRINMIVEINVCNPVLDRFDLETDLVVRIIGLCFIYTTFCQAQSRRRSREVIPVAVVQRKNRPSLTCHIVIQTLSQRSRTLVILASKTHGIVKP